MNVTYRMQENVNKEINECTGTELKVLIYLITIMERENRIRGIKQEDMAKEVGITQPQIGKAIKELEKKGILKRDGKERYVSEKIVKITEERE